MQVGLGYLQLKSYACMSAASASLKSLQQHLFERMMWINGNQTEMYIVNTYYEA